MRTILILAFLALAGTAQAQTRMEDAAARFMAEAPPAVTLVTAASRAASPSAADDQPPARPKGTVKTDIDRSFTPSKSVVGALGYLCGLQPGATANRGVGSSYEPAGTFLGGQLRVAF